MASISVSLVLNIAFLTESIIDWNSCFASRPSWVFCKKKYWLVKTRRQTQTKVKDFFHTASKYSSSNFSVISSVKILANAFKCLVKGVFFFFGFSCFFSDCDVVCFAKVTSWLGLVTFAALPKTVFYQYEIVLNLFQTFISFVLADLINFKTTMIFSIES